MKFRPDGPDCLCAFGAYIALADVEHCAIPHLSLESLHSRLEAPQVGLGCV